MTHQDLSDTLPLLLALATAFVLGTLIGLERQWRQRTAGLRTNVLVAVGAAAFVELGIQTSGQDGGARVISYVVSGIGFLGAGVIMKEGTEVRGLNTAATLWASAAVGAFAGVGRHVEAALVTGFVLAGNTMLRPLVDFVNRRPLSAFDTEALYRVHVVCAVERVSMARDMLYDELETHNYPVREIETLAEGDTSVELGAALLPTSADGAELDRIVAHISKHPAIVSATWTVSAMN